MGFLDKALNLPGDAAKAAAEVAARLPGIPLDIADKTVEGTEKGMDKLIDPKKRPTGSDR